MIRLLGWLLLAGQPLYAAITIAAGLQSLPVRGAPVAAIMALRAVVAGISMAAGSALLDDSHGRHGRHGAGPLAMAALGSAVVLDVFVLSTSFYPNNRAPGDTPLYLAATVLYHGGWITYLLATTPIDRS
jgi:hypothetical protein